MRSVFVGIILPVVLIVVEIFAKNRKIAEPAKISVVLHGTASC